jgi:plastocyanin
VVNISLVAQEMTFNLKEISVPAGVKVVMSFENKDIVPHNFAVYEDSAAVKAMYKGELVSGPKTITFEFMAPSSPGTYYFRCDIHTFMNGSFIVTAS